MPPPKPKTSLAFFPLNSTDPLIITAAHTLNNIAAAEPTLTAADTLTNISSNPPITPIDTAHGISFTSKILAWPQKLLLKMNRIQLRTDHEARKATLERKQMMKHILAEEEEAWKRKRAVSNYRKRHKKWSASVAISTNSTLTNLSVLERIIVGFHDVISESESETASDGGGATASKRGVTVHTRSENGIQAAKKEVFGEDTIMEGDTTVEDPQSEEEEGEEATDIPFQDVFRAEPEPPAGDHRLFLVGM